MKLLDELPQENLNATEESFLCAKIHARRNEDDINRLVMHNMRIAFLYAKRCCRGRIEDDELFSLCYTVLRRNAVRYHPRPKIRFFAFTKVAIRGAISRYWTTLDVVKSASKHEVEDLNWGHTRPAALVEQENGHCGSFGINSDWCRILITGHLLANRGPVEPSVDADFRGIDYKEQMAVIHALVKKGLTEQERMILSLVYTSGFNFQEVGNLLGVTRSAAQSIHSRSIKKIRAALARNKRLL